MAKNTDIKRVAIRKIFDSSGNTTVEATVETQEGVRGVASAPSGKSKGKHEVNTFPNNDVDLALANFQRFSKVLIGQSVIDQSWVDYALKARIAKIGGNVSTAVSIAVAKAAAASAKMELYDYVYSALTKKLGIKLGVPRPLGNIIGGGLHSHNSGMSIQEILVATESKSAEKNIWVNAEVHRIVGRLSTELVKSPVGVNIERAWVLPFNEADSLEMVSAVKDEMRSKHGVDITLGIDFAASSIYDGKHYDYKGKKLTPAEQLDLVKELKEKYKVGILEDPMDEDDYSGFAKVTKMFGQGSLVVGDDLYTTNSERIAYGGKHKATNSVLIKVNQIGTLTDTIKAVETAKKNEMSTVISHRSSETTDNWLAHLGVAFGSTYIKTGTVGGERVAKLNELMRIDKIINNQ